MSFPIVIVDGIRCRIAEVEIYDNTPDFLLYPLNTPEYGITKAGHELPGWIRPENFQVESSEH